MNKRTRDQLIFEYLPLVRFIAKKIAFRLPANIELDDLVSCGTIGLMDAIKKFDPKRKNKFATYAKYRIKGAILDELRTLDWIPRWVREKNRDLQQTIQYLEQKLCRAPDDEEIMKFLEIPKEEYREFIDKIRPLVLVSINQTESLHPSALKRFFGENHQVKETQFDHVLKKQLNEALIKFIDEMPEQQRNMLSLYYYGGFDLEQVGRILGVSESRASQINHDAMKVLREKVRTHL